jgi:ribosome-binding factor A
MTKGVNRAPSQRQLRVGEEIRHALAQVIERGELHDPVLAGISITVAEVRVSPDLRNVTAFVSKLGGGDSAALLAALKRAEPFIRRRMGQMVRLKFTPKLSFEADTSYDYADHIDELLKAVPKPGEG